MNILLKQFIASLIRENFLGVDLLSGVISRSYATYPPEYITEFLQVAVVNLIIVKCEGCRVVKICLGNVKLTTAFEQLCFVCLFF